MTTTPNLGIPLLDGAAPNDWRDINTALEGVDGAVASGYQPAGDYLTPATADALFLTPAEGDAAYAAVDHTHPSEQSGQWRFQDTAGGTPGAGYLRTNSGALATATTLIISRTTQDGYDIPPPGWGVQADDTIYIQDRDDSTKWVRYTALEPLVRFPTYATGLVEVESSAGGAIVNGQLLQVTFSLAGGGGGGGGGGLATDPLADAKGDTFAASGADAVGRLAVGADGQVLTADSAQTLGVKWATPAAAGMSDPTTATGDLIVRGSSDPYAYLVPLATPGGPGGSDSSPYEFGYEFSCSTAKTVTGIGWYRVQASSAKPSALRLWDTTATSSAVIAVTSGGSITDNGAAGWQFTDVSALGYTLVAGRHYRVSYSHTVLGGERCTNNSGIPGTPDAGVTGYGTYYSTSVGAYPNSSHSVYFGSNIRLGSGAAGASATRLPVGTTGYVLQADNAQTLGVKWGSPVAWTVTAGEVTTSATAGAASALPGAPAGYLTVVINGTARRLAFWNP